MGCPEAIAAVPGVDMSDLQARKHEISQQLMKAAEGVGFFYVTGKATDPNVTPVLYHAAWVVRLCNCRAWASSERC